MKIALVIGTRPEIIKMAPIVKECQKREISFILIHTNQHYSAYLDKIFFKELKLPLPDYNLEVGSGNHGIQTGEILMRIEPILLKEKPDVVLVEGDTNSVFAGALAASKLHIKIGHVEAGLRCFDRFMPEEINRRLTDHISDILFAPTKESEKNLKNEGVKDDIIYITGNTIVDAVFENLKRGEENSKILKKLNLSPKEFFFLTLHRAENVDNREKIYKIFSGLDKIISKYSLPIIFPIHPRTKKMIKLYNFVLPEKIKIISPVSFSDSLTLEKNALLLFTDSGGVQEEGCILGVPSVTLRDRTERPETIKVGSSVIAGIEPENIVKLTKKMLNIKSTWENPFGDGNSAKRIIDIILKIIS
jgi:UDP-N-acetylglucosamine 2-epimerase (non-hydrolysing)